ncbi:hypothetical protein [Rhizobium sp. L1K21]|uniref:hypothetical protein n=1 Tax=Rhizobium sp. L1K21 TaxID=2954933 RepID=UPI0020936992|nr:hypothetical protein [Rhizobium sp. L1K21]MCO6185336.1 hypothetical protein [Rhizobium sp. L1K21]
MNSSRSEFLNKLPAFAFSAFLVLAIHASAVAASWSIDEDRDEPPIEYSERDIENAGIVAVDEAFAHCAEIKAQAQRLQCYDNGMRELGYKVESE